MSTDTCTFILETPEHIRQLLAGVRRFVAAP